MRGMKRSVALLLALAALAVPATLVPAGDLQRGFSFVRLGMTLDEAKDALRSDPHFRYRGEPDVQFLPLTEIPLIETAGRAFIDRAVLQFQNDFLAVITLMLDRSRLDYFSVYESLVSRYGQPARLDPGQAVWEDGTTRIALERPLSVKYMDVPALNAIIEAGRMEEALDEVTRERFLDQL